MGSQPVIASSTVREVIAALHKVKPQRPAFDKNKPAEAGFASYSPDNIRQAAHLAQDKNTMTVLNYLANQIEAGNTKIDQNHNGTLDIDYWGNNYGGPGPNELEVYAGITKDPKPWEFRSGEAYVRDLEAYNKRRMSARVNAFASNETQHKPAPAPQKNQPTNNKQQQPATTEPNNINSLLVQFLKLFLQLFQGQKSNS